MNIRDLKPDQYTIVSTPTNINQLQPGSYTYSNSPKPKTPLLSKDTGGFGTALKDVGIGAAKSFVRGGRGVANLLQGGGKAILGTFGVDTSNMGIPAINNNTPQGQMVSDQLKPKSIGEKVGGTLETVAELGTGFVKSGAQVAIKKGLSNRSTNRAVENVTPKPNEFTPMEYENLLRQQKISPKGKMKSAQYNMSDEEKVIAGKYKTLLQSKDPVKNSINVMEQISRRDAQVGQFLKKNNGIFNSGELKNYVLKKLEDVDDITVDSAKIQGLKNKLTDGFTKALKKNNMHSLWEARKNFDKSIEKVFNGSPNLQNTVKKEFRNAIQDFIAERTPEGAYKNAMKDMRELFSLQEKLATKASKERTLNAIQKWMKNNPGKVSAVKWMGLGGGGFWLGNKVLGD